MAWIITTKLEMTRVVKGDRFIPVTLLQVPELRVVWFKTLEKDGYEAIIIWVLTNGANVELAEGKVTLNKSSFSKIKEFPVSETEKGNYSANEDRFLIIFEKEAIEEFNTTNVVVEDKKVTLSMGRGMTQLKFIFTKK